MQKAGYNTAMIGKYHLNSLPVDGGFDYWNILDGQGEYYNPTTHENNQPQNYTDWHVIDMVTNVTKTTINNFTSQDKPWMIMMHHKAPHRNQAAPAEFLGSVDNKTFPLPETFWDNFATKCPASGLAENKVKHLYWSNDLKLNIPDGKSDPGIGGGSTIGFNATAAYENFLARMTETQKTAWLNYYSPISEAFYKADYNGTTLEIDIYQRMMRDYI